MFSSDNGYDINWDINDAALDVSAIRLVVYSSGLARRFKNIDIAKNEDGTFPTRYEYNPENNVTRHCFYLRAIAKIRGRDRLVRSSSSCHYPYKKPRPVPTVTTTSTTSSIKFDWTKIPGQDYAIDFQDETITDRPVLPPFELTGLQPSQSIVFRLVAEDRRGKSVGAYQTVATDDPAPTAPASPVPSVTGTSTYSITVSWDTVPGATSYDVYYSTSGPGVTTSSDKFTNVTSPFEVAEFATNVTVYVRVVAKNAVGDSELSTEISGTTDGGAL